MKVERRVVAPILIYVRAEQRQERKRSTVRESSRLPAHRPEPPTLPLLQVRSNSNSAGELLEWRRLNRLESLKDASLVECCRHEEAYR